MNLIKSFLVLFVLFFLIGISSPAISNQANSTSCVKIQKIFLEDFTERVLIDGEWWIIVYSDSGVIKAFYKEIDD